MFGAPLIISDLKRFNLRPARLESACTSHPAQEAGLGTVGSGCKPGLPAGFSCRCAALVFSSCLSHTVDEITEVSAHAESESRIKANIWTSLALQGLGSRPKTPQAGSMHLAQPQAGRLLSHRVLLWGWLLQGRELAQIQKAGVGSPGQCWGKRL